MITRSKALRLVEVALGTSFGRSQLAWIDSGWDYEICHAGEWVIRVARNRESEVLARREIAVLDVLRLELGDLGDLLPTPRELAPGITLGRWIPGRAALASDLWRPSRLELAVKGVHRLRRDQLPDLPVVDGAKLRSIITSALRVVHDQRLESEVSARLEDSLSIDALWTYPLAPVHGDLGLEHIIVDNGGEVSGIIDWSDVRMDDRAVDLAGIAKTAGLETAMMVASRLDENARDDSWFVKRVALRADWAQLLAIVHQMRGLNLGSSR